MANFKPQHGIKVAILRYLRKKNGDSISVTSINIQGEYLLKSNKREVKRCKGTNSISRDKNGRPQVIVFLTECIRAIQKQSVLVSCSKQLNSQVISNLRLE